MVLSLSVPSDDVNDVLLSFSDVEPSADLEVILGKVDELFKDSVISVFCGVCELPGEVVMISDDGVVILNTAPYNLHCSNLLVSYGKTHCMPSGKSVKIYSTAKHL